MADTKAEIMDATRRVLIEHGYADMTTQEVAEEVGKSHSLVHYHYETKEDLLVAFFDHVHEEFFGYLADLEVDPAERLTEVLSLLVSNAADDDGTRMLNLAVYELQTRAPHREAFRDACRRFDRDLHEVVEGTIREGIEAGDFEPVDPERTTALLLAAIDGAAFRSITLEVKTFEPVVDGLVEFLLDDLYVADVPSIGDVEHAH